MHGFKYRLYASFMAGDYASRPLPFGHKGLTAYSVCPHGSNRHPELNPDLLAPKPAMSSISTADNSIFLPVT